MSTGVVRENYFEEGLFELLYGLKAGADLSDVVTLLAQEVGELRAEGKILLGDENGAHAYHPITMMSLPDPVPYDRNGIRPPC